MSTAMNGSEENMRLMQTLDDAWNAQDWETLDSRHAENDAADWCELKAS